MKLSQITTKQQASDIIKNDKMFTAVITQNKKFFYNLALKKKKWFEDNIFSVEDLIQESYISFQKALKTFDPSDDSAATLSTYAYKVISNDLSRKAKKHVKSEHGKESIETALFSIGGGNDMRKTEKDERPLMKFNRYMLVENEVIDKMMMEEAISKLSDVDITILRMKADGKKAPEIAKAVKMDRYTYKKYLYKHLPRLIHHLKQQLGEN